MEVHVGEFGVPLGVCTASPAAVLSERQEVTGPLVHKRFLTAMPSVKRDYTDHRRIDDIRLRITPEYLPSYGTLMVNAKLDPMRAGVDATPVRCILHYVQGGGAESPTYRYRVCADGEPLDLDPEVPFDEQTRSWRRGDTLEVSLMRRVSHAALRALLQSRPLTGEPDGLNVFANRYDYEGPVFDVNGEVLYNPLMPFAPDATIPPSTQTYAAEPIRLKFPEETIDGFTFNG